MRKAEAANNPNGQRRCLITGELIPKNEPVIRVQVSASQSAVISRAGLVLGVELLTAYLANTDWIQSKARKAPKRARRKAVPA